MSNKKRILVADDQAEIRQLLHEMLGSIYDVVCVCDGRQLYALMTTCRDQFDLIITDIDMPDWTGPEGVECARGLGVDIPVLYITGLGEEAPNDKGRSGILEKPFQGSELVRRVQTMLHQKEIDQLLADVGLYLHMAENDSDENKSEKSV